VATAMSVPTGQHPRVTGMLQHFGNALHIAAPGSSAARAWDRRTHDRQPAARPRPRCASRFGGSVARQ
jgi:hypothetical protein